MLFSCSDYDRPHILASDVDFFLHPCCAKYHLHLLLLPCILFIRAYLTQFHETAHYCYGLDKEPSIIFSIGSSLFFFFLLTDFFFHVIPSDPGERWLVSHGT